MKKYLYCLFAVLLTVTAYADGPFIPGQVLTANQLNSALATKTNNTSAAITGGTINGATVGITTPAAGKFTTLTVNTANPAINYQSSATGSTPRGLANKLGDEVNLLDFAGCDATGVTDSSTCVQNAVNSLTGGGRVKAIGKFLVNSNLTIPTNVTIEGNCVMPGSLGNNASSPYGNLTCGVIKLNSAATVTLGAGAGLKGLVIYRSDMTFPAPNSSSFAGTAITAGGDDVSVDHVLVMGFNKGFYSNNWQRTRISYFYGDNINGIEIASSYDIAYISHSHMWPFATIGTGGSYTNHLRSGSAIYLRDVADWAKVTDSFSWGYYRGLRLNNVNSVTVNGYGADNAYDAAPLHTGSIGVVVEGTSQDTRLIGVQTAAQQTAGIYINTNAGDSTTIVGHNAWGGSTHGVWVNAGDAIISGSTYRGIANGVTETNAASRVTVTANRFQQISGTPVNPSTATSLVFLDNNDFGDFTGTVGSSSMTAKSVVSADPLNLPRSGKVFSVTGATSFGTLSGGWAGRTVTLVFGGSLSVFNGSGVNNMALKNGANYSAAANSSLTLTYDGTKWVESGRSQTAANPETVTTLSASGQITSTVATGTAPFVVSSTTPVANLSIGGNAATASNASQLLGATWAAPGAVGSSTPNTGAFTSISASSSILSSGATGGVGYKTGSGGTVTQATSKTTGVTLNTPTGQITMNNAALAAAATACFTLTNSAIAAPDVVNTNIASGATSGAYTLQVEAVAAGSARMCVNNRSAGSLSEAIVINYAVIKGSTN